MKTRYLFAIAIGLLGLGVVLMDHNARYVAAQRTAILAADQAGTEVTSQINALHQFSSSHINANVALFRAGAYQRAVDEARVNAMGTANGSIYAQAQAACPQKNPVTQAGCISAYVTSHTPTNAQAAVVLPDQATFTYDFRSPGWAPDGAGLSLLAGFCTLILGLWLFTFRHYN